MISNRVTERMGLWRVLQGKSREVLVYSLDQKPRQGKVMISVHSPNNGEGGNYMIITAGEATLLKEFLIRSGY